MKVAIFIVAYNAEKTIENVLKRIPKDLCNKFTEIFIFDDCSQDDTVIESFKYEGPLKDKITIFSNQVNLGYGGNQKRGYRYAIEQNHDIVVLLHGDGQYAPEHLAAMIEPIENGDSDAVFGSRMINKGAARSGGMPLYKFIGNKILTGMQNFCLSGQLSEYHSGYRAYRVSALKNLPLLENTNDFYFDTEIIIQMMEAGSKITEIPIPTYYGDEICHVNGLHYAMNVTLTTLSYSLHKKGILYDKRFDLKKGSKYTFKENRFSSHQQILNLLPNEEDDKDQFTDKLHVLDIGCGSALLAQKIKNAGHSVTGIDVYDSNQARETCDLFIQTDLEKGISIVKDRKFNHIIFADVLEHVREPENLLLEASEIVDKDGTIIASTGNIGHILMRLQLLFGRFEYTERGILDRTHVKLFTIKSFKKLIQDCSFDIIEKKYCPIPFENIIPGHKTLTDTLSWIYMLFVKVWPGLFAYQIIFKAKPRYERPSPLMRQKQILEKYAPFNLDVNSEKKLFHNKSNYDVINE